MLFHRFCAIDRRAGDLPRLWIDGFIGEDSLDCFVEILLYPLIAV